LTGGGRPARLRRALPALALAASLISSAAQSSAQTAADIQRAKQSFQAGATAYAAGEYLTAIQALETAYALTPLPAIAFSLAQAQRRQYFVAHDKEHLDRAIALYRGYVERVSQGGRRADALEALSQLEPLAALQARPDATVPAATSGVRRTRLMITTETESARLSLDGGPAAPPPLIREVSPGDHRLVVSADGYYSSEQRVRALEGELVVVPVSLRERPSRLGLSTSAGAEVYVDGAFASQGGQQLSLELPSGVHRVVVGQKGFRVVSQTLELRPGEVRKLDVRLERTPQRKAALTLLVAGGAALGTGVVLSALSIRAENQAEKLLSQRAQGRATPADLDDYEDAVAERDNFRLATIITLASAGGLFVTGLFLHELDRPDPRVLYRSLGSSGRRPRGAGLRVAPLVAERRFGALLNASF
jgi:hypothetical protein